MASSSAATPDTPITLKINFKGATRRFKLPLRELGASTLENKLRILLQIPVGTKAIIERYSDSAAAYVVLESTNMSVYKQLFRAAKAKQKLKLRVTVVDEADKAETTTGPKPVSVEDEPESSEKTAEVAPDQTEERKETTTASAPTPARGSASVAPAADSPIFGSRFRRPFTVCCNNCERAVPDAHFHCSTCDDGDFDLCQDCVNQGVTCHNDQHWLIKRTIKDGQITYSTTHVAPKSNRTTRSVPKPPVPQLPIRLPIRPAPTMCVGPPLGFVPAAISARTCNSCVQEFPEKDFLHCTDCEDFDLCKACFSKDQHGHHPKHGFVPAVKDTVFELAISERLNPGRNAAHNAICDGCDDYIRGVRHKCLDCPDWDYCSECVENANFIHPNHRFVPIYERLSDPTALSAPRPVHTGICCDGPLCTRTRTGPKYIVGDRYKCAVCHDTDFCASCEASPANTHNKTHPLIKFKTPVRHVSVSTTGEHENGQRLPYMGDRVPCAAGHAHRDNARSSEARPASVDNIAMNPVQTVVDVKPTEEPELVAVFKHDTVEDGTIMPPNHTFEQTWVMRNDGDVAWPAGCSVKFVGGDYMGAIDPSHPAGIHELVSASESTVCYTQLQPGQEFPFTVLMRTPEREGKVISYWRLTTADGIKFGHKLWCDVSVQAPVSKGLFEPKEESLLDSDVPEMTRSQMIIPKLEHESPASSVHIPQAESEADATTDAETETVAPSTAEHDAFEDCTHDDDWAEESEDGFMTDEEYDILDASDEEYLFEQQKLVSRK
ncbi:hypothetical protein BX600DRAFT_233648 [Xylariales sp. PMI_506]|nr:hypothetical protein BX600DRAFT_233648 [Xylariales sp. PMI_506]